MTTPRPFLIAAAVVTLAAATLATASDVTARGRHGGGHGGSHRIGHHHGHHHGHQLHLRHHRHQQQRSLFSRFTPCVVWTRQGWINVCGTTR